MIERIARAIIVGAAVILLCLFAGLILGTLGIAPVTAIGAFLSEWSWAIGVLAGLWHFFGGSLRL